MFPQQQAGPAMGQQQLPAGGGAGSLAQLLQSLGGQLPGAYPPQEGGEEVPLIAQLLGSTGGIEGGDYPNGCWQWMPQPGLDPWSSANFVDMCALQQAGAGQGLGGLAQPAAGAGQPGAPQAPSLGQQLATAQSNPAAALGGGLTNAPQNFGPGRGY